MLASRAASLEKEMGENYLELGNSTQAAVIFAKAASYMKEAEEYSEAIVLLERAKEYAEEELKPSIDQELISLKSLEKGVLEKKAPEEILPKKKKAAPRKTPRKPVAKKTE